MAYSTRQSPNIYYLMKKKTLFVPQIIIHKSILNDISCIQNCIWSTVAPVYLALRNTKANAEPSKKKFMFSFAPTVSSSTFQKLSIYIYIYIYIHMLDVYHKAEYCS